jgi:hypothetical protein
MREAGVPQFSGYRPSRERAVLRQADFRQAVRFHQAATALAVPGSLMLLCRIRMLFGLSAGCEQWTRYLNRNELANRKRPHVSPQSTSAVESS